MRDPAHLRSLPAPVRPAHATRRSRRACARDRGAGARLRRRAGPRLHRPGRRGASGCAARSTPTSCCCPDVAHYPQHQAPEVVVPRTLAFLADLPRDAAGRSRSARAPVPRAGLDRAAVVALALAVVDDGGPTGYADLTLAAVAARAGVAVPSLYKHVAGLPGLRREVALVCVERVRRRDGGGRAPSTRVPATLRAMADATRGLRPPLPGRYPRSRAAPGCATPRPTPSARPPPRRRPARRGGRRARRAARPARRRGPCGALPPCTGSSSWSSTAASACPTTWTSASRSSSTGWSADWRASAGDRPRRQARASADAGAACCASSDRSQRSWRSTWKAWPPSCWL